MESLQFEKEYRVHVYETGPDGKLSLDSFFNYLQDIASDHAVILGFGRDDLMKDNRFWVLSRMYATITEWPFWKDNLIIKTWTNGTDRLFALRNYEIRFPNGKQVALGTSSWLILDRTSKKVQRPDLILTQYNPNIHPEVSSIRYASKLEPASQDGNITAGYRIKVSDLDMNLHSNNVRYLKWISDSYDLDFVMKNVPQSAEINYLAESLYDQEIMIRTSQEKDNSYFYNHSIFRTNDNKEICRIRIGWKASNVE